MRAGEGGAPSSLDWSDFPSLGNRNAQQNQMAPTRNYGTRLVLFVQLNISFVCIYCNFINLFIYLTTFILWFLIYFLVIFFIIFLLFLIE